MSYINKDYYLKGGLPTGPGGIGCSPDFLNHMLRNVRTYAGAFACDNIPLKWIEVQMKKKQQVTFSLISNLSKAGDKGTHWVAIIVTQACTLYMDPFGNLCTNPNLIHLMMMIKKPIFTNVHSMQHLRTDYCGLYCAALILHFNQSPSVQHINTPNFLYHNIMENDKICYNYIMQRLHEVNNPIKGTLV